MRDMGREERGTNLHDPTSLHKCVRLITFQVTET